MKIKTADLVGPALDWAVAQCEVMQEDRGDRGLLVHRIGYGHAMPPYSTNWSQGGPIIEREHLQSHWAGPVLGWAAMHPDYKKYNYSYGPTPLIAAMRCYVAATLGEEVDVPEELL